MRKKTKLGRPKLPDGEVRAVFPLRLSPTERARFAKAAEMDGEKLPVWMRKVLTRAAKSIS